MSECIILGDGAKIAIKAISYERARADNISDANWIACNVILDIPPFCGEFEASFSTEDFRYFERELGLLSESLAGKAVFETDEGALRLLLVMRSRGELTVEGEAVFVGTARTSLKFRFSSDQSYLDDLLRGIGTITREFPVKGHVGGPSSRS
jgi:hypothetical protein